MAKIYPSLPGLAPGGEDNVANPHVGTQIAFVDKAPATPFHDLIEEALLLRDAVAPWRGGEVIDEGGLDVGAFPVIYQLAGSDYEFDGQTGFGLTDDATNYVYLDADETLEKSTVSWPGTEHHRLAKVTTVSGDITGVEDWRAWNFGRGSSEGWAANAATENVDLDGNDILDVDELELAAGSANATAAGRLRRNGPALTWHDGTVARTLLTSADVHPVVKGGTGLVTLTDHAVMLGSGAAAVSLAAPSTAGQVLLDAGAAADPLFGAVDLSLAAATVNELLTSRGGTGTDEEKSNELVVQAYIDGTVSVAVAKSTRIYIPNDFVMTGAAAWADTAPTGAAMILDVRDDSVSVWDNVQADMINISASANVGSGAAITKAISGGSWLDVEIEQVGSSVAGADVCVTIFGYTAHRS